MLSLVVGLIASLIIRGVILFTILTGTVLAGKETTEFIAEKLNQPSPAPVLFETIEPSPSFTPAPILKPVDSDPVDSDPIVTCQFRYLPWQKIRLSECKKSFECQVGPQWYIYNSQEECGKAQNAWLVSQSQTNQTVPVAPEYNSPPIPTLAPLPTLEPLKEERISCVLDRGTYFVPPETCEKWKAEDAVAAAANEKAAEEYRQYLEEEWQRYNEELEIQAAQIQEQIDQCKREVNEYYRQQIQNCQILYGATSANPACVEIMKREREKVVKKCEY